MHSDNTLYYFVCFKDLVFLDRFQCLLLICDELTNEHADCKFESDGGGIAPRSLIFDLAMKNAVLYLHDCCIPHVLIGNPDK